MNDEYKVYIEETSVRLFFRTVRASTSAEATAFAKAALEDDTWAEWDHGDSDVTSLRVCEDGTELVGEVRRKREARKSVFVMQIEIVAKSRGSAELLRDEIVGAIEDNHESREIAAEAIVGPLDQGRPEERAE